MVLFIYNLPPPPLCVEVLGTPPALTAPAALPQGSTHYAPEMLQQGLSPELCPHFFIDRPVWPQTWLVSVFSPSHHRTANTTFCCHHPAMPCRCSRPSPRWSPSSTLLPAQMEPLPLLHPDGQMRPSHAKPLAGIFCSGLCFRSLPLHTSCLIGHIYVLSSDSSCSEGWGRINPAAKRPT